MVSFLFITILLLSIIGIPFSKGHAVWQQVVKDETNATSPTISTILTFAEAPGMDNVGRSDRPIQILYSKILT